MAEKTAPTKAFIGLGANLGDPEAQVRRAFAALAELPRTRLIAASSLYRSAPVGVVAQLDFVNAVAEIQTALGARALLEALLAEERRFGRTREFPNAPRTLDLDLLLYGGRLIAQPGLLGPHPRLHQRPFLLAPLSESAPDIPIPGKGPAPAAPPPCPRQEK